MVNTLPIAEIESELSDSQYLQLLENILDHNALLSTYISNTMRYWDSFKRKSEINLVNGEKLPQQRQVTGSNSGIDLLEIDEESLELPDENEVLNSPIANAAFNEVLIHSEQGSRKNRSEI